MQSSYLIKIITTIIPALISSTNRFQGDFPYVSGLGFYFFNLLNTTGETLDWNKNSKLMKTSPPGLIFGSTACKKKITNL